MVANLPYRHQSEDDSRPYNPERDTRKNIEINVGKPCNNKCVFCLDGFPKGEENTWMPWEEMSHELERWHKDGVRSIGFLGGEPTAYPHIVEAVQKASDLGYTRIVAATNANRLRRKKFTDRLLEAGLTRVTISMHGHTAELEDNLTRVPGNFDKKVKAISYLLEKKKEGYLKDGVSVNVVLNGWNAPHQLKLQKFFFDEIGLDDLRFNFIRPEGFAEGSTDLTPNYEDVVPKLMKCVVLNEFHYRKTFTFGGVPMCMLPKEFVGREAMLRKYMGEYRDLSTYCSIKTDGFGFGVEAVEGGRGRFNWQERKRFDLKAHPPQCKRCSVFQICEGIWKGYLDIYGPRQFTPLAHLPESADRDSAMPTSSGYSSSKQTELQNSAA